MSKSRRDDLADLWMTGVWAKHCYGGAAPLAAKTLTVRDAYIAGWDDASHEIDTIARELANFFYRNSREHTDPYTIREYLGRHDGVSDLVNKIKSLKEN